MKISKEISTVFPVHQGLMQKSSLYFCFLSWRPADFIASGADSQSKNVAHRSPLDLSHSFDGLLPNKDPVLKVYDWTPAGENCFEWLNLKVRDWALIG